ncbi:MAG: AAA family ATPase, partial [Dactylosporangium sp.]|nr:AAA family ATPase [Dactylosporangium sp.]
MRSILVTGVQGVGKTTVATRAAQLLGCDCWDYADLMLRVEPSVQSKDGFRDIPWELRRAIYEKVDVVLQETFWPGDGTDTLVLLENHLTVIDEGKIRTFDHGAIRRYNALGLAVIEADPAQVVRRRREDPQRSRHAGTVEEVADQQQVNR